MDISIFQVSHKEYPVNQQSNWIKPLSVDDTLQWNSSDLAKPSIRHLNKFYCELTAIYWAWHHCSSEYIGLIHYRRYFNFCIDERAVCDIMLDPSLQEPTMELVESLTGQNQRNRLESILSLPIAPVVLPRFSAFDKSISSQFITNDARKFIWNCFIDKLSTRFDVGNSDMTYFDFTQFAPLCNMFVMPRDTFKRYCSDLFWVIDSVYFDIGTPFDEYNNRYPAFLAERFLGFWIKQHGIPYFETPVTCLR